MLFITHNTETKFLKDCNDFLFWGIDWEFIH